jgi:hypothetical protein
LGGYAPLSTLELAFQAELKQNINCLSDASLPMYYFDAFKKGDFLEVNEFAKLLFFGGEFTLLIEFCAIVIEKNKPLKADQFPWAYLVESIYRLEAFPPDEIKEALKQLCQNLNLDEVFATSPHSRKLIYAAEEVFDRWTKRAEELYDQVKLQYLDQLKHAELEGAPTREDQLIQKLMRIDSQDAAIVSYHKKLRERHAINILSQRKNYDIHLSQSDLDDPQVKHMYSVLFEQMIQIAEETPIMAMDFTISLIQFGEPADAEKILQLAPLSSEKDWLLCEILLLQNKFVDLLTLLPKIEIHYAHDAQTFFHTAYLRAKCFYGLGQKETAVEVLESITTTQPDYRDSSILLTQWRYE